MRETRTVLSGNLLVLASFSWLGLKTAVDEDMCICHSNRKHKGKIKLNLSPSWSFSCVLFPNAVVKGVLRSALPAQEVLCKDCGFTAAA